MQMLRDFIACNFSGQLAKAEAGITVCAPLRLPDEGPMMC